jgi:bile acid:Na+ symporter, BASS family
VDGDSLLIGIGLPVALFVIMVGIGLTLTTGDFRRERSQPRGMVIGAIGQLIVMPLVGLAIVWLLGLQGPIAIGLVIIATVPGGTTSNVISYLGRANVALSIVLTVVASLATVLTIPLVVEFAIDRFASIDEAVSLPVLETVGQLVLIVLVPVVIGMVIRARRQDLAARIERGVSAFGAVILVVLIVGIAIGLGEDVPVFLRQAGPAVILLNVAGLLVGGLIGWLGGLHQRDRVTIAVELGIKNATLGILVATLLSDDPLYAAPSAVYGLLMYVSAVAVVVYGRRSMTLDVPPPVPS